MPAFGAQLTESESVAVVCHERYTLGGADPTSEEWAEEFETWCSAEAPVYAAIEGGEFQLTAVEVETPAGVEGVIIAVGPEPIEGSGG